MLLFDLEAVRAKQGGKEFENALAQASKRYGFGDMGMVEKLVTPQNAHLGVYTDSRGKTYHRLLLKNEDGKFFDYRMNGQVGDKKAWLSEADWKRKLGLGEGFAVDIVRLELPGAEAGLEMQSRMSEFLTPAVPESTSQPGAVRKKTERGPLLIPMVPAHGPKSGETALAMPRPDRKQKQKSQNQHVSGLEKSIEESGLDRKVLLPLQREDDFLGVEHAKLPSKYILIETDGGFTTVAKKMFRDKNGKPIEVEIGFDGLFSRLDQKVQTQEGEKRIIDLIGKYSQMYGVDFSLAVALFATESLAVREAKSASGCLGLGQLSRATAAGLKDKAGNAIFESRVAEVWVNGVKKPVLLADLNDVLGPEKNVHGSIVYLKEKLAQCNGNAALALAAYNSGFGSVQRFKRTGEFMKEHGNSPDDYALRGMQFMQFFSETGIEALRDGSLGDFLASRQYQEGYARLKEYAVGQKKGFKRGYISNAGQRELG